MRQDLKKKKNTHTYPRQWLPSDSQKRKRRRWSGGRIAGDGEKEASAMIFHHNPVTVE